MKNILILCATDESIPRMRREYRKKYGRAHYYFINYTDLTHSKRTCVKPIHELVDCKFPQMDLVIDEHCPAGIFEDISWQHIASLLKPDGVFLRQHWLKSKREMAEHYRLLEYWYNLKQNLVDYDKEKLKKAIIKQEFDDYPEMVAHYKDRTVEELIDDSIANEEFNGHFVFVVGSKDKKLETLSQANKYLKKFNLVITGIDGKFLVINKMKPRSICLIS